MFILIMLLVWTSVTVSETSAQDVSWELTNPDPVFGNEIKLTCTVKNFACCTTLTRVWQKIVSGVTTEIMNNGGTAFSSKYSETVDSANNQFSLTINSLAESDVDIDYSCVYGNTDQHVLTQNDSFIYIPTISAEKYSAFKREEDYVRGSLDILKAAPSPTIQALLDDTDVSSALTITGPTAIPGNTKFYTISFSLNVKASCNKLMNGKTLKVSVVTGSRTRAICDSEDLCRRKPSTWQTFLLAMIWPFFAVIVFFCAHFCYSLTDFCWFSWKGNKNVPLDKKYEPIRPLDVKQAWKKYMETKHVQPIKNHEVQTGKTAISNGISPSTCFLLVTLISSVLVHSVVFAYMVGYLVDLKDSAATVYSAIPMGFLWSVGIIVIAACHYSVLKCRNITIREYVGVFYLAGLLGIIVVGYLLIVICYKQHKTKGVPKEKPGPKVDGRPPPDTKHIKTENNLPLSENKPLPGIASHRPLPMPDLGKPQGGPMLEPLETDSMTEKKKKKKKKKKSEERDDE